MSIRDRYKDVEIKYYGVQSMLNHIKNITRFIPSKLERISVFILSTAVLCITALLLILSFPIREGLKLLFFLGYMTVSCTVVPIPVPQLIVYYGEMFNPLLIAFVGVIGAYVACLVDYTLLSHAFKYTAKKSEKIASLKETRTYKHIVRIFNKAPFITIAIAASVIFIPLDPVRLIAIAAGYNRLRYSIAIFIGRLPHYFLLASIGERLARLECNLYINAFLCGTILVAIAIFIIRKIFGNHRKRENK